MRSDKDESSRSLKIAATRMIKKRHRDRGDETNKIKDMIGNKKTKQIKVQNKRK